MGLKGASGAAEPVRVQGAGGQGPRHDEGRQDTLDSDFLVLLNLWTYLQRQQKDLSGSAFRRLCKAEFLHYLRVREWQDLHTQLRAGRLGAWACKTNEHPGERRGHPPLAAGRPALPRRRYEKEKRDYLGARGAHFVIQPGSVLHRRNPEWVMTAELVETSRLWARTNAAIDPAWVETGWLHHRSSAQLQRAALARSPGAAPSRTSG